MRNDGLIQAIRQDYNDAEDPLVMKLVSSYIKLEEDFMNKQKEYSNMEDKIDMLKEKCEHIHSLAVCLSDFSEV